MRISDWSSDVCSSDLAGAANPSPPIGPALGQRGVNIMEFCKAFNAATGDLEKNAPIPTVITVYADRSFSFATKTPPVTFLIKKAANLKKGSKEPGKAVAGKLKRSRPEARRVGQECSRSCRTRWQPCH